MQGHSCANILKMFYNKYMRSGIDGEKVNFLNP